MNTAGLMRKLSTPKNYTRKNMQVVRCDYCLEEVEQCDSCEEKEERYRELIDCEQEPEYNGLTDSERNK